MDRALDRLVRTRAEHRCEYCRISEEILELPFPIDHIMAQQHGGPERTVDAGRAGCHGSTATVLAGNFSWPALE